MFFLANAKSTDCSRNLIKKNVRMISVKLFWYCNLGDFGGSILKLSQFVGNAIQVYLNHIVI